MAESIVTKRCYICKQDRPVSEFHQNRAKPDGLADECKDCVHQKNTTDEGREAARSRYREYVSTPDGAARYAWYRLNGRVRHAVTHYPAYLHVEVRMEFEDFMAWAVPEYDRWFQQRTGVTPSLDRISSLDHYRIGNLQLIEQSENSHKSLRNIHLDAPSGMKYCGRCGELLPFECFKPSKRGSFGLDGWCIECRRLWEVERSKRRHTKRRDRLVGVPEGMNVCTGGCGRTLPAEQFKRGNHCLDCVRKVGRERMVASRARRKANLPSDP